MVQQQPSKKFVTHGSKMITVTKSLKISVEKRLVCQSVSKTPQQLEIIILHPLSRLLRLFVMFYEKLSKRMGLMWPSCDKEGTKNFLTGRARYNFKFTGGCAIYQPHGMYG